MKKILYLKSCSTNQRILKEINPGKDVILQNIKEQNIDEDAAPRFLQENDEIAQDEEIQQGQKEIEALIQTKLAEQKNLEPSSDEQTDEVISSNSNAQTFIDRYIKSDQGILIMLFLFVVSLILVFNFFVREK